MGVNQEAATRSRANLSRLQMAACQIIPQGVSIALSIRELVRQGYLLSAEILLRPLIERTASISYLAEHESAVALWEQGWPHKKRPSLSQMLAVMKGASQESPRQMQDVREIVDSFNSMVHGDPISAARNLGTTPTGTVGYLSSKTLSDGDKCDHVCWPASMFMIVDGSRYPDIPWRNTELTRIVTVPELVRVEIRE
jgi:hypothetical protein